MAGRSVRKWMPFKIHKTVILHNTLWIYVCRRSSSVWGCCMAAMDDPGICLGVCALCFYCVCMFASRPPSDIIHHCYASLRLRGYYLSFSQKHPLTMLTECTVALAVNELLVYLWIRRGVYQSHTDCDTDSIFWPLVLVLMIFLLKMSVSCCFCYSRSRPGNRRWKRRTPGSAAPNLILIKM